jgi:hypothetical protein
MFAQYVPSGSGTVRARKRDALDSLASALVFAGSVQQHGVRIGMCSFVEPDSRLSYSELGNEIRSFEGH